MDRHGPSGMFFNWYDEHTGAVLHTWPSDGGPVYPFLSSVDNGWLAAALIVVSNAGDPGWRGSRKQLLEPMNFKAYYDPNPPGKPPGGLLRGGFWPVKPPTPTDTVAGNYLGVGPERLLHQLLVRHGGFGDPYRLLHRHRPWPVAAGPLLRQVADLPGRLRLVVAGTAAGRHHPYLPRRRRVRGRVHLPRHANGAGLGWLDVRGADAGRLRAGGAVGPAFLGPESSADRTGASRTRAERREVRLLGILAVERPGGGQRLPRVRRRCHRAQPGRLLLG